MGAQQPERMRHIGVLVAYHENDPAPKTNVSAFTQALADLGWADGRNVRIDLPSGGSGTVKIKNRSQVIQYSRTLIAALNEVLDYDRERHHNQPPPELLIEDADYLREIRNLVAELRILNSFLESSRRPAKKTSQAVGRLANHFDNFLKSYGKSLGKGAGWLTIAVMASLLSQTGLGQDVVANILSHAKLPR